MNEDLVIQPSAKRVAMECALTLREILWRHGLVRLPDFVEAMIVAGLLVEKRLRQHGQEVPDFEVAALSQIESIASDAPDFAWQQDAARMLAPQTGVGAGSAGQSIAPGELPARVLEAGISSEAVARQIAEDQGLSAIEQLGIFAQAVAFAGFALTDGDEDKELLESLKLVLRAQARRWKQTLHDHP